LHYRASCYSAARNSTSYIINLRPSSVNGGLSSNLRQPILNHPKPPPTSERAIPRNRRKPEEPSSGVDLPLGTSVSDAHALGLEYSSPNSDSTKGLPSS
jgi:hypothetical protein